MSWSFYNNDGQILQGVLAGATLTTPVIAEIDSGSTITLDATTDIVLDADGGDVFLKDAGTTFGSLTNTSSTGNLIIKSGTTTALTFSGANATLAGNLTVNGTQTTISSTSLTVADTLIKLNQSYVGTAYDVGIVFTRGNDSATDTANRGFIWDATASEFSTIFCNTETGATAGNVTIDDYANLHVGALVVDDTTSVRGVVYTWPSADATTSGDMLTSNSSGTLAWTAVSAGVGLGMVIALGG
jgi:hypothetical protein